jgi:hypothetical protein
MTSTRCQVNRCLALTAEIRMRKRPSLNQSHAHTRPPPIIKLHTYHQQQNSLVSSIHVCVVGNEQLQSRAMTFTCCLVNRSYTNTAETRMRKHPSFNHTHTHSRPQPQIEMQSHRHHQQHSLVLDIHVCILRNEQLQDR